MSKWRIRDIEIDNQVIVAPMAGISNQAFRSIVKEMDAGLIYAEMVSTNGLMFGSKKTHQMLETQMSEHPISMQIFGGDQDIMCKAAIYIDQNCDVDIIDINFGCPAGKVNRSGGGSVWMKEPQKAYEAVKLIVAAVSKPVSVKFRLGWDEKSINCVEFAKLMEKAGASAVALHGRTRNQMYEGKADWSYIKQIKDALKIPVIGNGDIRSIYDAKRMLDETGCDAIMIGRGALGNPWLIKQCVAYLENGEVLIEPTYEQRFEMCKKQARLLMEIRPEKIAMSQMRSHALWYVKGLHDSHRIKDKLSKLTSYQDLESTLDTYLAELNNRKD